MYFTMFMILIIMTSFEIESNSNYALQLLVHRRPPSLPQGIRKMLPLHHIHEKQAPCQTNCSFTHCKAADFLYPAQQTTVTHNAAAVCKAERPKIGHFHLSQNPFFTVGAPGSALQGRLSSQRAWQCRTQPWLSIFAEPASAPACCRTLPHKPCVTPCTYLPLKYILAHWVISCILLTQKHTRDA